MCDNADSKGSNRNSKKGLRKHLEAIPGKHSAASLQKTAILGTSHIVREVLLCDTGILSGGEQLLVQENYWGEGVCDRGEKPRSCNDDNNTDCANIKLQIFFTALYNITCSTDRKHVNHKHGLFQVLSYCIQVIKLMMMMMMMMIIIIIIIIIITWEIQSTVKSARSSLHRSGVPRRPYSMTRHGTGPDPGP
jgi:hypothetical protein